MLLAGGASTAVSFAKHEKQSLAVLDGWIDLIAYIRGQIDCYLAPIDEILSTADKQLLHICLGKERSLMAGLRHRLPYLNSESQRLLTSFVQEMGSLYREEQLKRCDYYLALLRALREKQAQALPQKIKTSGALCFCAVIGTAILLW